MDNPIFQAMRRIEPCADRGALVPVRDLRKAMPAGKWLDTALLEMSRLGLISLHAIDDAAWKTAEQLAEMIYLPDAAAGSCGDHPKGKYFIGAAIRQN